MFEFTNESKRKKERRRGGWDRNSKDFDRGERIESALRDIRRVWLMQRGILPSWERERERERESAALVVTWWSGQSMFWSSEVKNKNFGVPKSRPRQHSKYSKIFFTFVLSFDALICSKEPHIIIWKFFCPSPWRKFFNF